MSDPEEITVFCPACQAANVLTPVTVAREGSPEVEALMAGSLNRVTCASCERSFLYDTALVYRDDERHWLIYYLPRGQGQDLDQALTLMQQLCDQVFGDLPADQRPGCRLVRQHKQLIEKIGLHRHDLDDRIIEYVKYQLFQHSPGLKAAQHELLFDFSHDSDEHIRFYAFDRQTGKPVYQLDFDPQDYADLREHFFATDRMQEELTRLFRGYYVSVDTLVEAGAADPEA